MKKPESFNPQLYTMLHTGTDGDVAFYRKFCEPGLRVLELGCGAGRITIPVCKNGCDVVGLDAHRGMLQMAREKALNTKHMKGSLALVQGDMRKFSFASLFDRVIIPFNSLYCLGGKDGIEQCLRCVFEHLAPDGKLAFDCYAMNRGDAPFEPLQGWLTTLKDGEEYIDVYEHTVQDLYEKSFLVTYTHKFNHGEVEGYILRHHYLYIDEFEPMLRRLGFGKVTHRPGFQGKIKENDQDLFVACKE